MPDSNFSELLKELEEELLNFEKKQKILETEEEFVLNFDLSYLGNNISDKSNEANISQSLDNLHSRLEEETVVAENNNKLIEIIDLESSNNCEQEQNVQPSSSSGETYVYERHLREIKFTMQREICQICWKTFSDLRSLRQHNKQHTARKTFECHICSKRFYRKQYLEDHIAIHENKRKYKCPYCDNIYNIKKSLKMHISRKHKEKKPYDCSVSDEDLIYKCAFPYVVM